MTDDTISKLLHLKRYEQPPPEYFENFLREFHRRQRTELLRRPAWRIALDRFEEIGNAVFGRFTLSNFAYAGASMAVLAIAGVMTLNLLQHPGATTPTLALNSATSMPVTAPASAAPVFVSSQVTAPAGLLTMQAEEGGADFSLDPRIRLLESNPPQSVRTGVGSRQPRYILDARPVSYEPPFSF